MYRRCVKRVLPLLLLGAVVAAGAAAAAPRTILSPAPVASVAADARWVAFAASPSAKDCDRIRVWNRTTGRVMKLGKTTSCESTSTGHGIGGLSMAGNRAVWLHFTGGNIREYQLFTATTTALRPRRFAFAAADVDLPSPIIVGHGDSSRFGDLIPVSIQRTVIALTASGRRSFEWDAPRNVTALGALAGGLAVGLSDGRVVIFDDTSDKTPDAEWTGSPNATAVFVTGNGVAAQRGSRVELRTGDGVIHTRQLPGGSRLLDAVGTRALYLRQNVIYRVDILTGATQRVAAGVDADFENGTVVANGRRISVAS